MLLSFRGTVLALEGTTALLVDQETVDYLRAKVGAGLRTRPLAGDTCVYLSPGTGERKAAWLRRWQLLNRARVQVHAASRRFSFVDNRGARVRGVSLLLKAVNAGPS